jgi:hypothetical protein
MIDDVNCPYCGAPQEINHDDGRGYSEDDKHEQQCNECEKIFVFTTSISYYYEAEKADCLNDGEHNYKRTHTIPREEKLETIVKLFSKGMFYGDWKWETPNERVIEMLMKEVGYYPFKDEDEMIRHTSVDDNLYKQAIKEVEGRYLGNGDTEKFTEDVT